MYSKSFDEKEDEVWTNAALIPHTGICSKSRNTPETAAAAAAASMHSHETDHSNVRRYIPISTKISAEKIYWSSNQRSGNAPAAAVTANDSRSSIALRIDELDTHTLFMPTMLANIFRLVRLLSLTTSHIFLPSFYGTSKRAGIELAAKLCNMKIMTFDCKGNPCEFEENVSSDRTIMAGSFKRFLKASILHAIGRSHCRRFCHILFIILTLCCCCGCGCI